MSPLIGRGERGFALIFVALALFLLATVGAITLASYTNITGPRKTDAAASVNAVYQAITGYPNTNNFGYLGDVGDYPASLLDLVQPPANTPSWNGPYLFNVRVYNSMVLDVYGSPLEYFLNLSAGSLDQIAIVSRGPDRSSSNGASNPNIAAAPSPFPGSGGYSGAAGNADNIYYPDFITDTNAVNYQNAGSLAYNITNFDLNNSANAPNGIVPGCPGLYMLTITSATRGAADTMNLQYSPGLTTTLGQGVYSVAVGSNMAQVMQVREQVNIGTGASVIHNLSSVPIDSRGTPVYILTIYNESTGGTFAHTLTVRTWVAGGGSLGTVTIGAPKKTFAVNACTTIVMENGGTIYDTFVMPSSNYTRYVQNPAAGSPEAPYLLTVTNGGTQSDQLQVIQANGLLLGTVYKRKTQTFSVPSNPLPNAPIPPESAGTNVNIVKKDGSALTSNPLVNPITANTSVTIP